MDPSRRLYLIYGSLFPLETDIFAFFIVTPCTQKSNIASVRSVTSVLCHRCVGDEIGTVSGVRSGRGSSVGHGGEMFDR